MPKSHAPCRRTHHLRLDDSLIISGIEVHVPMLLLHDACATLAGAGQARNPLNGSEYDAGFNVEDLEYLAEEESISQAWVPLRVISKASTSGRMPTVIYLHATGAAHNSTCLA